MNSVKSLILIFPFLIMFSNCAVYMAATQPAKKAVELFRPGTPRALLLAEFGAPAVSEVDDDGLKRKFSSFSKVTVLGRKYLGQLDTE